MDDNKNNKNILEDFRESISKIDSKIIESLRQRFILSEKIAEFKKENNLEIIDSDQENKVIQRYEQEFQKLGIEKNFTMNLVNAILKESKRIQSKKFS